MQLNNYAIKCMSNNRDLGDFFHKDSRACNFSRFCHPSKFYSVCLTSIVQ